jgi:hypothetical protein
MKSLFLIFIVFLSLEFTSLAQAPDTMWTKIFGGSDEDEVNVAIETNDNGYVFGGMINDSSYVVKLSQYGDIIFTNISMHLYNSSWEKVLPNLCDLNSETYVMGFGGSWQGIKLIYFNGDSVAHFNVSHPGRPGPHLRQVCRTYDANYILVYITTIITGVFGEIQKVDTLGNELWYKWYFSIDHLIQTKDSAFAFIGRNYPSLMPLILARTDIYGDTVWTQEYQDTTTSLSGVCLEQVGDEGFIILANDDNQNVRLLRTNEWGELIWEKTYGQSGIYSSKFLKNTPDGGHIIVGSTESVGAGGSDVWVLKTDSLGNIKWTKTIGGTGDDYGKYIQTTSDGGYIIAADTWSYGKGEQDIWIIKLEPDPTVDVDNEIDIIKNYKLSYNYPNPFNPSTNIIYSIPQLFNVIIKVFDILGNEIETLVNEEKPAGSYEITWYAEGFPNGIYFYQLKVGSFVETKKMILLK